MAELIDPSNYQDFTLQTLMTPDGITKINNILRQLSTNISGDTESVRVFTGVGTPEASVTAGVGSLYMRTDGGSDTSVYRKESGSANTGWVAIKAPASLPLSTANGGLGADASAWTAGDFIYLSSTGVIGHIPITFHGFQFFNASGTFLAPAGITKAYITMIGAGGGGKNVGATIANPGGGGGSGSYILNYPYTIIPGNSYTVSIGAGGSSSGGNGGNTSFDLISVNGGSGGTISAGGAGGTGGLSPSGKTGGGSSIAGINGANGVLVGGGGAGSLFGIGGNGGEDNPGNSSQNGNPGIGFGSGGGGSGEGGGGSAASAGGIGANGMCIVAY